MQDPLRTEQIETESGSVDFESAKERADATAAKVLTDPICLSWYDRAADRESPAHVGECHDDCDVPGYVEYAVTRGAELKVVVGEGAYVFCYRPLGEFAES